MIQSMVDFVAQTWGVNAEEIINRNSRRSKRELSEARFVCIALTKSFTDRELKEIGNYFGGRHHATILYAIERVAGLCYSDRIFREKYDKVRNACISGLVEIPFVGRVEYDIVKDYLDYECEEYMNCINN